MTTQLTTEAALFIGGEWIRADGGRMIEVHNPAHNSVVGMVSYGGRREALAAVDAAQEAFGQWANTSARVRSDILMQASKLLQERAEHIGYILALETGKRLPEGVAEVKFAAEYFRWFAEQARRPSGELMPQEIPNRRYLVMAQPAGVALCLTPWSFPVSIQARKIAPALAAGCTVVARPSEKAPLAVIEMFRCLQEAGVPAGVANLIQGPADETTQAMLAHPAVHVVSFTSSTAVGRRIMQQASERIVRPLLELGGNAPFIVFEDANLDKAVEGAMLAKFRNNGQSCIAANRFFVQAAIFDEFVKRLAARINSMRLGDPVQEPVPDLGPMIDQKRKQAIEALAEEAEAAGARRVTSIEYVPTEGAYTAPALFIDVPEQVGLAREEIFGPIVGVFPFESEEEVITRANRTEMGLAAYFYTTRQDRAWRVGEALQAGIIGLNVPLPSVVYAPMGGVKQSGLGREGASLGMEEFQEIKYLCAEL